MKIRATTYPSGDTPMPRSQDCLIDVELALAISGLVKAMKLKAPKGKWSFRCPRCKKPVKPSDGNAGEPYFAHLKRSMCPLSFPVKGSKPISN